MWEQYKKIIEQGLFILTREKFYKLKFKTIIILVISESAKTGVIENKDPPKGGGELISDDTLSKGPHHV